MPLCDAGRRCGLGRGGDALERDTDEDGQTAVFVRELQLVVPSVQALEPRARVGEPDARPQRLQRADLQASAVVVHLHPQAIAVAAAGNLDLIAPLAPADAVLDRV